jgi:hypothetical protein
MLMTLEARKFNELLLQMNEDGKFDGQRVGQAFYNHFNLHKLSDQSQLQNLYERDGQTAWDIIYNLFDFM